MGKLRDFFVGPGQKEWTDPGFGTTGGAQFAIDDTSFDPAIFGLTSYATPTAPAPRISRREAIQVPACKRARDLIAGSLGGLPLDLYGPNQEPSVSSLFAQPEPDVPRSVTMTRTIEDLLFEGTAWWRVLAVGWHTYPTSVRRLDPRTVTVQKNGKVYVRRDGSAQGMADEWIPDAELIRFDSPNDGLLTAGARAIRTCLALDAAAARFSDGAPPLDYFTPAEGADPADDDDVVALLNDWKTARQTRSTGYIPAALEYHVAGWSPEQLQMADARQHAVLEIARVAGCDPEELGVSTTSRTYANVFDRRKSFIDFTLGGYRQAIEDRLSMSDVTPRSYYAKFNLSAFLRSDDLTRMQTYEIGLRVGAYTPPEIRELEDKPAINQEAPVPMPVAASLFADPAVAVVLDAVTDTSFSVDLDARTITGLAVPYGKPAMSKGRLYQFAKGTLRYGDISRVKLLIGHDFSKAVGYATSLEEKDEGLFVGFKVARGDEGDKALLLAEDKVLDGLSIGLGDGGKFSTKAGVFHAVEAPLAEISLTPCPSFDDARVLSVAPFSRSPRRNHGRRQQGRDG
jgi:HK97 family phage portal protein/HK97 family phage prohead protease